MATSSTSSTSKRVVFAVAGVVIIGAGASASRCRSRSISSDEATAVGTASAAPSPAGSPISARGDASLPAPPPSHVTAAAQGDAAAPPPPLTCPRFAPSLAAARSATAQHRWDDAFAAFRDAIRAKPFDAHAWAEQGYAEELSGKVDPRDSFAVARSLTKDRALVAATWFNEAETDARDGKSEDARLHYAVSASFGSAAALAKLGKQSRCTATWTTAKLDDLAIAQGWIGVLDAEQGATCGEQRTHKNTEAAARVEACRGCSSLMEPLDKPSATPCPGAGPWTLSNGYMQCHSFAIKITPLGDDHFLVDTIADAFENDYEKTADGIRLVTAGAVTHGLTAPIAAEQMSGAPDSDGCVPDVKADVDLTMPNHCGAGEALPPVAGPHLTRHWDSKGHARIDLNAWAEKSPTVTFSGSTAHIIGEGCDATIPTAPMAPRGDAGVASGILPR